MSITLPQTSKQVILHPSDFPGGIYRIQNELQYNFYDVILNGNYTIYLPQYPDPSQYLNFAIVQNTGLFTLTIKDYQGNVINVLSNLQLTQTVYLEPIGYWKISNTTDTASTLSGITSIGGVAPVYAGILGGVADFKGLTPGSYISLVQSLNDIMINALPQSSTSTNTDISILSTSVGGGLAIYAGPTLGYIDYRSLAPSGSYISLNLAGGLITPQVQITAINQYVSNNITILGVPSYSVASNTNSVLSFKSLIPGSYISITSTATTLVINSTSLSPTNTSISLLNTSIGGGLAVYNGPTLGYLDYNSFSPLSSYISISLANGLLTPQVQITAINQYVGNNMTILGVPSFSVANNSNSVLSFKSLAQGSFISIISTATSLMINSTNVSINNTDVSVLNTSIGGGLAVYAGPTLGYLDYNSLAPNGSYISLSLTGGLISLNVLITQIAQAQGSQMTIVGVPSFSVFNNSNSVLTFKSLNAGSNISILSTATTLSINSTNASINATDVALLSTSIGGGLSIYNGPTLGYLDYNSISQNGSYISLSLANGLITPQVQLQALSSAISTNTSVALLSTSIGGGLAVYNGPTLGYLDYNSIAQNGSYISLSLANGLITPQVQLQALSSAISTNTSVALLSTSIGGGLAVYNGPTLGYLDYNSLAQNGSYISLSLANGLITPQVQVGALSTAIGQNVVINNTSVALLSTSIGGGLAVYNGPTLGYLDYNSISANGSYISLSLNNGLITPQVQLQALSSAISNNTSVSLLLTSVGGGIKIYDGATNGYLNFNTLGASSYININLSNGLASIGAQNTSIYQMVGGLMTIVGVPSFSVFNYSSNVINFLSLAQGSYISIVPSATTLMINSTFIATPLTNSSISILSSSVGNGLPIYAGPTAGVIDYNSLASNGSYISLSLANGLITPQVDITALGAAIAPTNTNISLLLTSVGGGVKIYDGPTLGYLNFNTLSASSYININLNNGLASIGAQNTSIYQMVGGLITVVGVPSYSVFNYSSNVINFLSLAEGSYVGIVPTATTLLINATYVPSPTTNSSIAILSSSVGGGLPIYAGPTAGIIDYNSLASNGSYISLSLANGLITPQVDITALGAAIAPTNTNISLLLTSVGGGINIYDGPTLGYLNFNTLSASSYININLSNGLASIRAQNTSIYQMVGGLITVVGVPSYSVFNYSSNVINFLSLAEGSYVGIVPTATTLLINATYVPSPTTNSSIAILSSSVGGGLPIYAGPTAGIIDYNSLASNGSYISLSLANGLITPQVDITALGAAIAPTNTNISLLLTSVGGGVNIYDGPTLGYLNFNTLSASSYININLSNGLASIGAQNTSIYQMVGGLITVVGVPSYSVFNYSSNVINFLSLAEGSYVGIVPTATTLLINATYVPSPTTNSSIAILSSSVGGGLPIYAGPTAGIIDYNSLAQNGSYISLSLANGLITPQVDITALGAAIAPTNTNISLLLTSVGGGINIYDGPTLGYLNFNTLSASSYININLSNGLATIRAQNTSIYQMVGGLITVVGVPSYSVFNYSSNVINFLSLAEGSYVGIVPTATTLLINATYVPSPTTNSSIAILSSSVGGGLPIYAGPTAGIIDYNSLATNGSYISLSLANGLITPQVDITALGAAIAPTNTNISLLLTSVGGGINIYDGPTLGYLNFNTLSASSYININLSNGLASIRAQNTSIYQMIGGLITVVGVPSYSVFNYSSNVINFLSLAEGSYVGIVPTATTLLINATYVPSPTTNSSIAILSSSVGGGLPIYAGPTAGIIDYNSLAANGSYISLSLANGLITPQVDLLALSSAISTNTSVAILSTSIGGGVAVYNGPTLGYLDYNSLSANGSYISLSLANGLITPQVQLQALSSAISTNTSVAILSTSIGGGIAVYNGPTLGYLDYNSLSANGSYISLSLANGLITPQVQLQALSSAISTNTSVAILSTSIGGGIAVYNGPTLGYLDYNSLSANGSYISISLANGLITPQVQLQALSSAISTNTSVAILSTSIGGGIAVYNGPTLGYLDYNSLSANGSFISLSLAGGLITPQVQVGAILTNISQNFVLTNTSVAILSTSIGGGIPVYNGPTLGYLDYNSIASSGSFISVSLAGGVININSTNIVQSAGAGITIANGVISSTGGSGTAFNVNVLTTAVFTSNGTWLQLSSAQAIDLLLIGGGGGGGSGAKNTSTSSSGGAGGNPGYIFYLKKYPASLLATAISVTVGTGGTGGASVTANTTAGNAGNSGTQSQFGTFVALGGNGGGGGQTTGFGFPNTNVLIDVLYNSFSDAYTQITALNGGGSSGSNYTAICSVSYFTTPTGGSGGSSLTAGGFQAALNGGYIYNPVLSYATAVSVTANQSGTAGTTYNSFYGTGGVGGNGTNLAITGGVGGSYGGGGGGGNQGLNSTYNSGAGGSGSNGVVVVVTYG